MRPTLVIACVLLLGGAVQSVAQDRGEALRRLLLDHQQQKKDFGVQDVYKLLFQAHLGIGHMLADSVSTARYLDQELEDLDTTIRDEDLVERISTDSGVVRINLRPFMVRGIPPQILVRAMIASDRAWRPDTAGLRFAWEEFVTITRAGELTFPREEVDRWDDRIQRGFLEPVHHSESYTKSNRPAYRVVRRSIWDQAWHEGTPLRNR